MATRRILEEKVGIIFMYGKYQNINEVIRQWPNNYSSETPSKNKISNLVPLFRETGTEEDLPRTGRPLTATSLGNLETAKETVQNSPKKSVRRDSLETEISRSSYHPALQKLDLRAYRPQFVVELSDDDFDRRSEFCEKMLEKSTNDPD